MSREFASDQKEQVRRHASPDKESARERTTGAASRLQAMLRLQRLVGNRAVQRLLAQRRGGVESASASLSTGFELDDETAGRITRARSGGQPLESGLQAQMGEALGYDFGGVRVHTGRESDELNQQLSARAFTTGQDIFVRSGEYNPASSGGRELIAHELSHVVQQGTGRVPAGGSGMTVRPASDAFEQEADALALQAANAGPAVASAPGSEGVQRQEDEEEELQMMPVAVQQAVAMQPAAAMQQDVQRQEDEEEELQMMPVAMQQAVAMQPAAVRQQDVQRQEDEEEELQMMPVAMQQGVAMQPAAAAQQDVQRQDDEEEELQMMPVAAQRDVQRHEDEQVGE